MENVSSWILSICGICIVSVLIDTILPNGKTNKYIKSIFAFIVIFIIISPLPALFNRDFDMDSILSENEFILQEDYIYQLNRSRLEHYEETIETAIKNRGLNGVKICISANIFDVNMKIDAIFVDLFNLVINEDMSHINTNEVVVECILKCLNIEKEKIIFNE